MSRTILKIGLLGAIFSCGLLFCLMNSDIPQFPNIRFGGFNSPVIALEFIQSNQDLASILGAPKNGADANLELRIDFFRRVLSWDFLFITVYFILILFLLNLLISTGIIRLFLLILLVLLVLFDIGENIFSFLILDGYSYTTDLGKLIDGQYKMAFSKWTILFIFTYSLVYLRIRRIKVLANIFSLVFGSLLILFLVNPLISVFWIGNISMVIIYLTYLLLGILAISVFW